MSRDKTSLQIDVNINNLILTPLTCASLINTFIKCLIYDKTQIPYSYKWLETIVNKKRKEASRNDENNEHNKNYQAEKYFRKVSNFYDTVESILKQIDNIFKNNNDVEEILLIFGGSEMSPKEVYRIRIPTLPKNHQEKNHITVTNKLSYTVLRQIFLSPEWENAIDNTLTPTNMFVFLKTNATNIHLEPNSSFYITKRTLVTDINLIYEVDDSVKCDCNFSVFQDDNKQNKSEINLIDFSVVDNQDKFEWYQLETVLKGFKEEFANKVPLSELW